MLNSPFTPFPLSDMEGTPGDRFLICTRNCGRTGYQLNWSCGAVNMEQNILSYQTYLIPTARSGAGSRILGSHLHQIQNQELQKWEGEKEDGE